MEQSLLYGSRGLTVLSGSGDRVTDATGREYVDFLAGHGAALFGHAHPRLRLALEEAAASPWTIGAGLASPFRERFLADLESALPESRAFLCNSGTEAVEAALKLLRVLHPGRRRILALRRAFHGRTLGALGLTFNPRYRAPWKDLLLSVEHLEPEHLPDAVNEHVAAVFVEPVQGEGGMATLSAEVGKAITEACRRWDALLVADEIQTGWGRCGALLASFRTGLDPDWSALRRGSREDFPQGLCCGAGGLDPSPREGTAPPTEAIRWSARWGTPPSACSRKACSSGRMPWERSFATPSGRFPHPGSPACSAWGFWWEFPLTSPRPPS
jgi:acetylornithine/LysW-gamma-L-lysine aminotransferase